MKAAPFAYHRPATVADAVAVLHEHGGEAVVLAGGQSLLPRLYRRQLRPAHVVDLGWVAGLSTVEVTPAGVRIGAMVRQQQYVDHSEAGVAAPLLHAATRLVGHPETKSRGTMGGSLALALPVAEVPAALLALNAVVEVAGTGGQRTVAVADLLRPKPLGGLAPGELLTAIVVPRVVGRTAHAADEVRLRRYEFPIVAAFAQVTLDADDHVADLRLTHSGMGRHPRRAAAVEASVLGSRLADVSLADLARAAVAPLEPVRDVHADVEYKVHAAATLTRRVLQDAWRRAEELT